MADAHGIGRLRVSWAVAALAAATLAGLSIASADDGPPARAPVATAAAADQPPVKLLVRFNAAHPMSKAAALAARGDGAGAEALARRTLRSRADLAGLCFEDFTLGGAELVLTPCEAPPQAKAEAAARRWVRYLKGLPGVDYADQNVLIRPAAGRP